MTALHICDDCKIAAASELCRAGGFGIEVQSFYDPEYIDRERNALSLHREALTGIDSRSFHGPFGDLCPGSFDVMVREVARTRFEQAVETAGKLGIEHLILHHGYLPGTSKPGNWIKRSTEFWKTFLSGLPRTCHIHIENLFEHDPEILIEVIQAVNDPRLDVCLDIGHVHCHGKVNVIKWIEQLGDRIGYVHLHDNHGTADEHLGLGEGTLPVADACHALQTYAPDAIWGLEVSFDRMQSSLRWLLNRGLLLTSPSG
ncbi:MAG: sugar phosphate isomerase/epimerase [candidate division Zixibacteria bacterium]|nr:sugar phosphate isomerase/epimerase [candidate division Zixibacteria bacterium]